MATQYPSIKVDSIDCEAEDGSKMTLAYSGRPRFTRNPKIYYSIRLNYVEITPAQLSELELFYKNNKSKSDIVFTDPANPDRSFSVTLIGPVRSSQKLYIYYDAVVEMIGEKL